MAGLFGNDGERRVLYRRVVRVTSKRAGERTNERTNGRVAERRWEDEKQRATRRRQKRKQNTTSKKATDAWRPVMRRECNQEMGSVVRFSIFRSFSIRSFSLLLSFFTCIKPNYLDRIIYIQVLDKSDIITHRQDRPLKKKRVGNLNRPAVGKRTLDPSTSFLSLSLSLL